MTVDSITDDNDNFQAVYYKFKGLLDEFTVFKGVLPSSSIQAIYNGGVPNNVNELIENNQISGNCLGSLTMTVPNFAIPGSNGAFQPPIQITTDVDNGEFDVKLDHSITIRNGTPPNVDTQDFSDNYTVQEQGNIIATLPIWHRIGVASYDISLIQDGWDEEFFNSYVHTDNLRFIEKADNKHDKLGVDTKEVVKLKVNAIKKLLPYEGFYPQDRTVQLANLFVEKISPDIIHNEKVYKEQAVQAALQHFFAPGILYNSIKAGIACDWASYTNESGLITAYRNQPITALGSDSMFVQRYSGLAGVPEWYSAQGPSTSLSEEPKDLVNLVHAFGAYEIDTNTNERNISNLLISQEATERLPFESLLDPYRYIVKNPESAAQSINLSGYYQPQPNASEPVSVERKSSQYFLMLPSYYQNIYNVNLNDIFTSGTGDLEKYNFPYFEIRKSNNNQDFRYEMAINNFVAESTIFFLKGGELSSFASKPENEFKALTIGKTYVMDCVISKSDSFEPVSSPGTLGGRYFGPPMSFIQSQMQGNNTIYNKIEEINSDPAFAAYVPPYYYGENIVRISFVAERNGKHSLSEILSGCTIEDISVQQEALFLNKAISVTNTNSSGDPKEPSDGLFKQSPAWKSKMPIDSSIELFGRTKLKRQEYNPNGTLNTVSSSNDTELDAWVIYTKFECPLFDFSGISNSSDEGTLSTLEISTTQSEESKITANHKYTSSYLDTTNTERFTIDKRTGSGIWAGYGQQRDNSGVTISIQESFPKNRDSSIGSLMDVCGFVPQSKQIGRVADSKEISEAVVMIPFLDKPLLEDVVVGIAGTREVYSTVQVDDRNFIKVSSGEYHEQMRKFVRGEPIYTLDNGQEIMSTSITKMIEGMNKYNIPPLYDFNQYSEQPFIMYFFEFNHTLDREDLSNIWQGVQPKIAKEASLDSVEISHEINRHELFGNIGEIPEGIRWMVFKVKKKAEKSYYNLTEDSRDDSRFKFEFEVGVKDPEYSYNYPYDYFTMLELIQVEAGSEKEIDPLEQLNRAINRGENR